MLANHWVSELRRLTGLRTRRHQPYCVWWVYWLLYMASKRPCCIAASTSLYVMMIARVRMCGRRFLIEVMLFLMACQGSSNSRLPHMCSSATTTIALVLCPSKRWQHTMFGGKHQGMFSWSHTTPTVLLRCWYKVYTYLMCYLRSRWLQENSINYSV